MTTDAHDPHEYGLTARRLQVLQMYADGGSRESIARALGIGAGTVAAHIRRASVALHTRGTTHTVAAALRKELIE